MESKNWLKEIEQWNKSLIEKQEKESKNKKLQEWGKLGGRPKKYDNKKSEKILLSLTPKQKKILDMICESYQLRPQELIRNLILSTKPKDVEKNKILMEYRTNFRRISNHFKSNVWSDKEKEEFKKELRNIISLIEKELKTNK